MNSSQPTQTATGNRITFTSQTIPNGTINIATGNANSGGHPGTVGGPTIISTSQLPNTTTIKTITSSVAAGGAHHVLPQHVQVQHHQVLQQGQTPTSQAAQQTQHNANQQQSVGATQTQTLVIKSNHHAVSLPAGLVSSAPGIVTMTKTLNQGNPPILNSMLPGSVVVGMRTPTPQQQKSGVQSNALGRVVIGGPHINVGARPQSPAITLSTLPPGQTPALILKTENGIQLLRVGAATSSPMTTQIIGGSNSTNPTQIRLQTVPASISATGTSIVSHSVATTNSSHVYTTQTQQQQQQTNQQQTPTLTPQQIQQQTQHLNPQPQITQIQTIPAQPLGNQQQHQTPTSQHQTINASNLSNSNNSAITNNTNNSNNNSNASISTSSSTTTTTTTATPQNTATQGNTKEKCRKFLANLIDLSTREPKPVEKNVRSLIQELVNANVEPEQFCDKLERLLNASPQPCLIGFLKKSLPLLRQALYTKELTIEGIKPPPQHVVGIPTLQQLPKIQAQIRPISQNQTTTIGQTQVRMITPPGTAAPRPIGQRPLIQHQTLRAQQPSGPRVVSTPIRGPIMQPTVPGHPGGIVTIRPPVPVTAQRPGTLQIRAARPKGSTITHVKVGQTHIKAIPSAAAASVTQQQPPSLTAISPGNNNASSTVANFSSSSSILSTINSVASAGNASSMHSLPTPTLPTVSAINANVLSSDIKSFDANKADMKNEKISGISAITVSTPTNKFSAKSSSGSTTKSASKKKKEQLDKDKDEKTASLSSASSTVNSSSFFQQPSISMSSTLYGDDDINDVAAMGGVNLAEESQRILGCTENIGTQIRSCKDEVFLHLPALQARLRARFAEMGLEEPAQDVSVLLSHACQEHLKNVVEKLTVIAEHRIDVIKLDPRYEISKDVRGQIKFLEELDKAEQKRHEEIEREMLLRAAKSRSKIEDPEQAKMKARAKEMQRAEMEELRQRDANMTALQAIGPRKKIKLESDVAGTGSGAVGKSILGGTGTTAAQPRPRIKRVNLRDMLFYMEQERHTSGSEMLYKAYLK